MDWGRCVQPGDELLAAYAASSAGDRLDGSRAPPPNSSAAPPEEQSSTRDDDEMKTSDPRAMSDSEARPHHATHLRIHVVVVVSSSARIAHEAHLSRSPNPNLNHR